MDRDEMIERAARALRATFYPSRTIRQTPEDEWKRRAAAVVDAITPDEYEPLNMRGGGPFLCRYHGNVDWCERDKPDRVPVYVKRTPPDAPEPDRCPTCVRSPAGNACPDPWHQGADR